MEELEGCAVRVCWVSAAHWTLRGVLVPEARAVPPAGRFAPAADRAVALGGGGVSVSAGLSDRPTLRGAGAGAVGGGECMARATEEVEASRG